MLSKKQLEGIEYRLKLQDNHGLDKDLSLNKEFSTNAHTDVANLLEENKWLRSKHEMITFDVDYSIKYHEMKQAGWHPIGQPWLSLEVANIYKRKLLDGDPDFISN